MVKAVMKRITLVLIVFILFLMSVSDAREVPFTQEDSDRLIRLETKVEEGIKGTNQRFEDLRGEVEALRELIYLVIGGIFVLIGFVIWDRRTALAPAIKKKVFQ